MIDPTNSSVVYVGTAGGGVWKSSNTGSTWSPRTDTQPSLAIGALAIDTTGHVIYAGTGEDNLGDSQSGVGILKSTDAGANWSLVGQAEFSGHHIGSIAIDRTTSGATQRVLAATDAGLYVSTDAGLTWSRNTAYLNLLARVNTAVTPSGAVTQVIQDPTTPNKFWLSATDFCATESGDILTGDGSNNWQLTEPAAGPFFTTVSSRIGLGIGPGGAAGAAWIAAAACNGNLLDLQKSADGGSNWIDLSSTTRGLIDYFNPFNFTGAGQGDYDNVVAVDPANSGNVVLGGVTLLATRDGGSNFADIGDVYGEAHPNGVLHPDFHAITFTGGAGHFYIGGDGGLSSTADLGGAANSTAGTASDWANLNAGLATIQYYSGSALDSTHLLGGSQDNGSSGHFQGAAAEPAMQVYAGGDGGYTAIDPAAGSTSVYTEYAGGFIAHGSTSLNPADAASPYDSFQVVGPCRDTVTPTDPACSDPTAFIAPFVMDPADSQRLVAATNRVYLSTDGGGSGGPGNWTLISPDLTTGTVYSTVADQLQTLFMGPRGETGTVLTGSAYGRAFLSSDATGAGAAWTNVTGNLPAFPGVRSPMYTYPNPWISGLSFNPLNASEGWATMGGLGVGHVWHTLNLGSSSGTTWTNIDGNGSTGVGNVVVNGVVVDPADPNTIYVATDFGVLACRSCGGSSPAPSWLTLGSGLPSVKVSGLSFSHDNGTLYAWTHGRGVWNLATLSSPAPELVVAPRSLTFTQEAAGGPPGSQNLTIANDGNAPLTWTATVATTSGGNWLSATPLTGTTQPNEQTSVTASVNTSGLQPGSYDGSIAVSSNGGSVTVPVTLRISPPAPTATTLHFPALMNRAYGTPGYTTTIYLENVSGSALAAGAARIIYFDTSGNVVGRGDTSPALVSGAVWTVRQDNGNSFAGGSAGSGVVQTRAALVGFVNQETPGADGSSYTAIPHPNAAASVYTPAVMNQAYGGYSTGMGITNTGGAATTVTVSYHDQAGNPAGSRTRALAPNAYWGLYQGEAGTPLPANFAGTAVLSTDPPQPLAVVVNEVHPSGQFLTYEGAGSGSTTLYAPVIFHDAYGGYQTGMGIQNVGSSPAQVTITYSGQVGGGSTTQTYTESLTVPAGGYVGDYNGRSDSSPVANPLPDQFHGSAALTSSQPLVDIVNEIQNGKVPGTSYNTVATGSAIVHLPLVENSFGGFNTGLGLENVGTGTATVTINYYDPNTGNQVGSSNASPLTLAPGQFAGIYQGAGGDGAVATGTRATATLSAAGSGAQLSVIVNQVSGNSFMSYKNQALDERSGTARSVAYQVNPVHTGNQPNTSLTAPLTQKWSVNLGGKVSYPLIADGKVFVTVAHNGGATPNYGTTFYALDSATGTVAWGPIELSGTYYWSNAAYDAGTLFVLTYDGLLRALDSSTGAQRWVIQLPGQHSFSAPPTATNGFVLVSGAGSGGTVYGVNENNGSIAWTQSVVNGDESSPAVTAAGVFVSYACNHAYGFNLSSGSLLWHHLGSCSGGGGKTTAVYQGGVYTRDSSGELVLDAQSGNLVNSYASTTIPAFDGSTGFYRSGSSLNATALDTNLTKWSFSGDGFLTSAPLVVNGVVYVGSGGGNLYAVRASDGTLIQTIAVGSPILAPDEQNVTQPLTGLGAGENLLVVPATNQLVAYGN